MEDSVLPLTITRLIVSVGVVLTLQALVGLWIFRNVFDSFSTRALHSSLREGEGLQAVGDALLLLCAYVFVIGSSVVGGSAVASWMAQGLSTGGSPDPELVRAFLFVAAIVGTLVGGFARLSSCHPTSRDEIGRGLVCALYWQVSLTLSTVLVFGASMSGELSGWLGAMIAAIEGLARGYYIDALITAFVITVLVTEISVQKQEGRREARIGG